MDTPSALSVVPPLLALGLAVGTRNVLVSLSAGVFVGIAIHADFNPFAGLLDMVDKGLFAQLADLPHAKVIIIIAVIGGFVNLLDRSGGLAAFARRITRVVDSPAKAQLSVWLMGISIFFTDSGNSLILGPMFRPIFDGLRLCREKLAFIIDSTSSPVCVLVPFISWGVYVMSLMGESFTKLGLEEQPLGTFLKMLPFQLYPILAIATVPLLAFTGREWGPMARAQRRAENEPAPQLDSADEQRAGDEEAGDPASDAESGHEPRQASGRAIVLPMATMLLVLAAMFTQFLVRLGELPAAAIQVSLVLAYLAGAVVCALILSREKVFSFSESLQTFIAGMGKMALIVVILLLAWSLGDVCELLGTGKYVATLFDGLLQPGLLPATIFVLGAVVSLSTGSAWGTFALLMPIGIPMAHQLDAPLLVTIAAVLSGGMFGDHCSPVSDTTVLSSMSSGCAHADHVSTQLGYAAVTGSTALIGFLIAGFTGWWFTVLLVLVLQLGISLAVARIFGVPIGSASPAP
ncbi:MAG: hypothetical protein DRI90_01275 [Deltaproteobacteria bacterium]|nr:MAG: hypothetical protein DRI90_01275 [Deltaproteobacteria bacterium]